MSKSTRHIQKWVEHWVITTQKMLVFIGLSMFIRCFHVASHENKHHFYSKSIFPLARCFGIFRWPFGRQDGGPFGLHLRHPFLRPWWAMATGCAAATGVLGLDIVRWVDQQKTSGYIHPPVVSDRKLAGGYIYIYMYDFNLLTIIVMFRMMIPNDSSLVLYFIYIYR